MKEGDRAQFAKELRANLGDVAAEWKHDDVDDSDYPLGKTLKDVSDADRVHLVPDDHHALFAFATDALKSAFLLSEAIEKMLAAAKTKE
jgi:hypothetical protein